MQGPILDWLAQHLCHTLIKAPLRLAEACHPASAIVGEDVLAALDLGHRLDCRLAEWPHEVSRLPLRAAALFLAAGSVQTPSAISAHAISAASFRRAAVNSKNLINAANGSSHSPETFQTAASSRS